MITVRGADVRTTRLPYILAFAVIAAASLAAATLYYRAFRQTLLAEAQEKLRLVAELKVVQVQHWRRERLGDIEVLAENPAFGEYVARALAARAAPGATEAIVNWLGCYLTPFGYDRVTIFDGNGRERIVVPARPEPPCPVVHASLGKILRSDRPVFLDLHPAGQAHVPRLSTAIRITAAGPSRSRRKVIAALVMRSDPERYLFPLIKRWPSMSQTSETLLVRRDGDSVLYLNELRLRKDTALRLRLPLSQTSLLASQAIHGAVGPVKGTDYRGKPVLGYVLPVADSPWFLVARVDEAEALAPTLKMRGLLALIVGMVLVLAALALGMVWSRQRRLALNQELAAVRALTEGENRYRLVLETMDEGYLLIGHDLRFIYVNRAAARQLGRSAEQMAGQLVTTCFPDVEETRVWRAVTACLSDRTPQTAEVRTRDAQGKPATLVMKIQPVPEGVLVLSLDVSTERRQADEIAESEQRFRTLTENMAEGVALHEMIYDEYGNARDYRIVYANPAFARHTGIALETAVGRTASEVYGGSPPYLAEYARVAETGEHFETEVYFEPMRRHFRISSARPRPGTFATLFEDVTDRVNRERELADRTAEMERFTYAASHDLRSPLVTVTTFLGYLKEDLNKGDAKNALKDIEFAEQAASRMSKLLDELLRLSRVGRVVNQATPTTFHSIVNEALAATAGALTARGVAVEVTGDDVHLSGDVSRLVEVVQNLVDNAVKFMGDQAKPRIEIGAEGTGRDTVFYVRDNGMGIEPRHQSRVFGMFDQLDPHAPGIGAGLALVKRIVEYYEGKITVESAGAYTGTCFRFTLPAAIR
ncbi:MAG: PAS domain-containing sensor histidine kinase [Chthonomonadales bacterium]|nr:PAS domain-containing sensor histidine kinase [Chthonomonadales bacterium]